ncbi:hypothetical protein BDQ12DRAFT_728985 [Crucibulum laeve]|uniref:DUF6534 domain-containing protein n=1 Tax=Crucibulum laeve TaxID=68775 RepID=A0A5C3LHA5_9AGAR|nr:hypothetical protein BDQ12DRAFT_728985 [Crucibulum laeve]
MSSSPSSRADIPALVNIPKFAGPLARYLLNWSLFGALTIQVYVYYLAFPRDRFLSKALVYGVYVLETLQTILIGHDAFVSFAANFGDVDELTGVHFGWLTIPILSGLVSCCVQLFYADRLRRFSRSWTLPGIVAFIAITQCVASIVVGIHTSDDTSATELTKRVPEVIIGSAIWNGGAALCDVIISVSMTYYLLSRSGTGLRSTQALVVRLVRLTIETGTVTATLALATLILIIADTNNGYYFLTSSVVMGKLYSNTLMVNFNLRMQISGGRHETRFSDANTRTLHFQTQDVESRGEVGNARAESYALSPVEFPKERTFTSQATSQSATDEEAYNLSKRTHKKDTLSIDILDNDNDNKDIPPI